MKKIFGYEKKTAMRLDTFTKGLFPYLSRQAIHSLLEDSKATVNGKKAGKGTKLKSGDSIELDGFPEESEVSIKPNPGIDVKILYMDEHILALDKPRGLPSHPNDYNDDNTLANGVAARFPQLISVGEKSLECGLLNRLDNDTSGIILAAKTDASYQAFRKLFKEKQISKEYIALVVGHPKLWGSIEVPLIHDPKNQKKMTVAVNGKPGEKSLNAQTTFITMRRFGEYTLLKVVVPTAVTHQIRAHLASIGNPLAGDKLYQNRKTREFDSIPLEGHFLHASKVKFFHPFMNKFIKVESDLPKELMDLLESLT